MKKMNVQDHPLRDAKKAVQKLKVSTLAASITLLIAQSVSTYASDIEIYTKPATTASSASVVMMLDTSGSMDIKQSTGACDVSSYDFSVTDIRDSRGFTVNKCYIGVRYYYRSNTSGGSIRKCNNTASIGSTDRSDCNKSNSVGTPNLSEYVVVSDNSYNYYFKATDTKLDRISRLKEALYILATTPTYDAVTAPNGIKENVNIGIGTFPYYDGSENNQRGYVRVAAAKWDANQKQKVLDMINNSSFRGIGGTPTSAAYAEAASYLLGTTTGGGIYSGMSLTSDTTIVSGSGASKKYKTPLTAETASCSGQGIYFLTDGQPQTPLNTNTSTLMANALRLSSYTFSDGIPNNGTYDDRNYKSDWKAIGSFAKSLNDLALVRTASGINELSRPILTAVVGFGSGITGNDKPNVESWGKHANDGGLYGLGGYIPASDSAEVVSSLNDFIAGVTGTIPSISTGSSTIPLDTLNPEIIQPYSYFPQFEPKVADETKQQLWFGNLKKYHVVNNGVFADENGIKKVVVEVNNKSTLQDVKDIWANGTASEDLPIYAKYGVLAKLPLGTSVSGQSFTGRKLLTDYDFDGTNITQNLGLVRITHQYTTDPKTKLDNADRIKGLMGLLGYNISDATMNLSGVTATLRQMGSILHSLPVLITQEGQAVAKLDANNKVVIDTEGRKDYVLFGTTQGLLHVVDAKTGVEKFSFLPKEMAEKQYELFKNNAGTWNNGKDALYYGVDGEWAAHTVYVSKNDGTLTVDGVVRNVAGSIAEKENLQGKQWVYGGLRMGGRSYYALDLTGLDDTNAYMPKIKFQIDPSTGTIKRRSVNADGKVENVIKYYPAISKMGQSWSKPKLDYVNWKGERKLVMFVGGGYDAGGTEGDGLRNANGVRTAYEGYEKYDYAQTNEIGSGVYMFDADNGDLLWYASKTKHSSTDKDKNSQPEKHTSDANLQYSVVSEIKTVDRNNDGIVDHLYFGDLAGQTFRVDLNKPSGTKFDFDPQVTRILNLHNTNNKSPRFYLPPVFTAHHSVSKTEGGNIVMATFISGNKSSPLLGDAASPQKNTTALTMDAIYGVYQYDILPTGVYYPDNSASDSTAKDKTLAVNATITTTSLRQLMPLTDIVNSKTATVMKGAKIDPVNGWGGWYYKLNKNFDGGSESESVIKGITPLVAMEGNLYATLYDSSEDGSTETCGAGVKGQSFTQRICLPTGVCQEEANFKYNLGSGIVNLNVGPMASSTGNKGIIIPDPTNLKNMVCVGKDCPTAGGNFIPAGGALKFIPHRWYERYSTKGQ